MTHISFDGSLHDSSEIQCSDCLALLDGGFLPAKETVATEPDPVNPDHYKRGPIECIQVTREIRDFRLASAMKYLWRVSFGGKIGEDEKQDIRKAIWYLNDFLEH